MPDISVQHSLYHVSMPGISWSITFSETPMQPVKSCTCFSISQKIDGVYM